ncbi:hypothetical protein WJX74_000029 [Apatococcus lobatus]|uniref:tRNA/rRNA methyltransferase SpoU type domain-containing protein n=1 Tax=Apatococcus lobatus TaxID=904363 RepID=A0AAW1RDG5_9CHLO
MNSNDSGSSSSTSWTSPLFSIETTQVLSLLEQLSFCTFQNLAERQATCKAALSLSQSSSRKLFAALIHVIKQQPLKAALSPSEKLQAADAISAACNRAINALAIGLVLLRTSYHDSSKAGQASPASMLFVAGNVHPEAQQSGHLQEVIRSLALPILANKAAGLSAFHVQVVSAIASTVHEHMQSELFASLITTCIEGLEACLAEATGLQAPENNREANASAGQQHMSSASCCMLLSALLTSCASEESLPVSTNGSTIDGGGRLGNSEDSEHPTLMQSLVRTVLALLGSGQLQLSKSALQLLPSAERAITAYDPEMLTWLSSEIWMTCRPLAEDENANKRQAGLAGLVAFKHMLLPLKGHSPNAAMQIAATDDFWRLVQHSLTDSSLVNQKRAMVLLKMALASASFRSTTWTTFELLHSVLDEFALTVIQGMWTKHMFELQSAVSEDKEGHPGADNRWSQSWNMVIWRKALGHPNPQVQRFALAEFFAATWTADAVQALEPSLMSEAVFPGLIATGSSYKDQAAAFFASIVRMLSPERQLQMLQMLMIALRHPIMTIPATNTLMACLQSAAEAKQQSVSTGLAGQEPQVMMQLRGIAAQYGTHGSLRCARSVWNGVIRVASALCPATSVQVVLVAQLLGEIPQTDLQGPLLGACQKWLLRDGDETASTWLLQGTQSLITEYFRSTSFQGRSAICTTEFDTWASEAERLGKLIKVCIKAAPDHNEDLFVELEERVQALYRPYLARGVSERTLLLLLSFVQAVPASHAPASVNADQGWWLDRLAEVGRRASDTLSSFASGAIQAFWQIWEAADPQTAATPLQPGQPVPFASQESIEARLPMQISAHFKRAHLGLEATLDMAHVLLRADAASIKTSPRLSRASSGSSRRSSDSGQSPIRPILSASLRTSQRLSIGDAAQSLMKPASVFLQNFGGCPLPRPGVPAGASAGMREGHFALQQGIQQACLQAVRLSCTQIAAHRLPVTNVRMQPVLMTALKYMEDPQDGAPEVAKRAMDPAFRWHLLNAILSLISGPFDANVPIARHAPTQLQQSSELNSEPWLDMLCLHAESLDSADEGSVTTLLQTLRRLLQQLLQQPSLIPEVCQRLKLPADTSPEHCRGLAALLLCILCPAWKAVEEAGRNPTLRASFISTAFMPQAFAFPGTAEARDELHSEQGPFHWAFEQLMDMGRRSLRVASATSLSFCRLLVDNPWAATYYADELHQLLLFDPKTDNPPDHVEMDPEPVPGNEEVSKLQRNGEHDLQQSHRDQVVAPRVAACVCLHRLSRIARGHSPSHALPDQQAAACVGQQLWKELLALARKPKYCKGKYPAKGPLHRQKMRLWQALCILSNFCTADDCTDNVQLVWAALQDGDVPGVRTYQEAILARFMLEGPELIDTLLLPTLKQFAKRPEGLPSMLLVGARMAMDIAPGQRQNLLTTLLPVFSAWTLEHHHATRTFAQAMLYELLRRFPGDCGLPADARLQAMLEFLSSNQDAQRLTSVMEGAVAQFHIDKATSPAGIFHQGVQLIGAADEILTFEGAAPSVIERIQTFLMEERAKLRATQRAELGSPVPAGLAVPEAGAGSYQRKLQRLDQEIPGAGVADNSRDVFLGLADDLVSLEDEAAPGLQPDSSLPSGIIIVASLLAKAPNIAGLSRTCEVFQAAALVVADRSIMSGVDFWSVSVTAERLIHILQVPPHLLAAWLASRRAEGYTCVGLEQTVASVSLPDYKFPEQTVLVLGAEKEGISPEILDMLDAQVEIPQLGLVRSLNVHVSGAIAAYEYRRQHSGTKASLVGHS